jgi:hypothetical protein
MGDPGDDGDKASPTSSHDVKPVTSGEEVIQVSRRGSEQLHKRIMEANMDDASKNGSVAPSEAREVDHTSTPAEPVQSHPMTTTTSTSSHLSNKDSTPPQTGYGTRSRNRPGAPRPNYAEDVEMDFEMAPQTNGRDHSSMDLSSNSPPAIESRQSPAPSSKRGNQTSNGWNSLNNNSSSIPGTSLFSANPNARVPHSRKRKATEAQSTGVGQSQSPAPTTQTVTRRTHANATQINPPMRESNMLSFDKHRAILKHGKLVADDGSSFSVNGTCNRFRIPYPYSFSFHLNASFALLTLSRSYLSRLRTSG